MLTYNYHLKGVLERGLDGISEKAGAFLERNGPLPTNDVTGGIDQ